MMNIDEKHTLFWSVLHERFHSRVHGCGGGNRNVVQSLFCGIDVINRAVAHNRIQFEAPCRSKQRQVGISDKVPIDSCSVCYAPRWKGVLPSLSVNCHILCCVVLLYCIVAAFMYLIRNGCSLVTLTKHLSSGLTCNL